MLTKELKSKRTLERERERERESKQSRNVLESLFAQKNNMLEIKKLVYVTNSYIG